MSAHTCRYTRPIFPIKLKNVSAHTCRYTRPIFPIKLRKKISAHTCRYTRPIFPIKLKNNAAHTCKYTRPIFPNKLKKHLCPHLQVHQARLPRCQVIACTHGNCIALICRDEMVLLWYSLRHVGTEICEQRNKWNQQSDKRIWVLYSQKSSYISSPQQSTKDTPRSLVYGDLHSLQTVFYQA